MVNLGLLGEVPSVSDVQDEIANRFDALFHFKQDGNRSPYVCCFCDEILMCPQEVSYVAVDDLYNHRDLFCWDTNSHIFGAIPTQVKEDFKFQDVDGQLTDAGSDSDWLQEMALSPRGHIGKKKANNRCKLGFSSCNRCKTDIKAGRTPFYSIINQNWVGNAPACLSQLTEVELAFITPVKGYGYFFKWVGGATRMLRGHLTFMRVEERTIAKAVTQLEGMGLSHHVVILLSGKMTANQVARATQKLRVEKIISAVEWLCENHSRWKEVDIAGFRRDLDRYVPEVINESTQVNSEDQNLESQEMFSCYYPDGTMTATSGSLENSEQFKSYVERMKRDGFNLALKTNLSKDFVDGKDGDQLISSCLLQFPYGTGGLKATRLKCDGSMTDDAELEPFLAHLTKLSQPVFQLPMFQLVVYSLTSKLRLIKKSRLQLKGGRNVIALANGLTSQAVARSIRGRQTGDRTGGTVASRALLEAVDGMSRALPHSNEAAKQARATGESMQHHFGIPSLFVTITFDDENSLLMQVLSNEIIDDDKPLEDLTDQELAMRATRRKELRLRFPGFGAISFEMLFYIAMEVVIGWNVRTHQPTEKPGLFGQCFALTAAMEEQGRTTVHTHLGVWIKNFDQVRDKLFFGNRNEMLDASTLIPKYFEHISTTQLFGAPKARILRKAFNHDCTTALSKRPNPLVIDEQGLRNLRHRHGFKENSDFANCPACNKSFTYENLSSLYCRNVGHVVDLVTIDNTASTTEEDAIPKSRMHAMCIAYQKALNTNTNDIPTLAINASYNSHASCHVSGCFKCQKKKHSNHTCGPTCECRFRMPDRSRTHARIRTVKDEMMWFKWNGVSLKQPYIEILPKRSTYDLFQNVSCKAISESKFTCNSNISIITDGPVGHYQFKYMLKPTQEDDSASYAHVEQSIKCMEEKALRIHEDDKKEALRRICRAAFAHNRENVIGPSLASYLTRHDSRFYFSHAFQYCPLRDLKRAMDYDNVSGTARYTEDGNVYFECQALHYLCRPVALERLTAKEFFETYAVLDFYKQAPKGEADLRFLTDTGYFKHPSARKSGKPPNIKYGKCVQGLRLRDRDTFIKVSQWMFPDTAKFKGNSILSCPNHEINRPMEDYAEAMLLLFYPYRSIRDLQPFQGQHVFPYVMKLRELNASDHMLRANNEEPILFRDANLALLQNLQSCAYNSLRYKGTYDDLQSVTEAFACGNLGTDLDENTPSAETEEEEFTYESLLQHCDQEDLDDEDPRLFIEKLQGYSFKPIRNTGTHGCGYSKYTPFVTRVHVLRGASRQWMFRCAAQLPIQVGAAGAPVERVKHGVSRIVKLYLTKSTARLRQSVFQYNPTAKVCDANGSLFSIRQWASAAKLDNIQRRAFESIIAAFLLTFFDFDETEYSDATVSSYHSRRARGAIKMMMWLKGGNAKDPQLILLLHGPAGSGKSTVIALVVCYAREYCDLLGHTWTIRTIMITAMSGVAATIVHGRTSHKAIYLNAKKPIKPEQKLLWKDTRLLLIDECSFCCGDQFTKIERHCRILMDHMYKPYGGLNVVYSGDFSQLEPPKQVAVYNGKACPAFTSLVNAFIELSGQHRYKDDPAWGELLGRFRAGKPLLSDINTINSNCLVGPDRPVPPNTPIAVYKNRNRDALNTSMFETYCEQNAPEEESVTSKDATLVFMSDVQMHDESKTYLRVKSNRVKSYFYSKCGEDACNTNEMQASRVDPVLKLYPGCPLMLTENSDVENGQANGSRVRLVRININTTEQPMQVALECGTILPAYYASQIVSITVRHEVSDITPQEFDVVPKEVSFKANVELLEGDKRRISMKGFQFPLISNSATTGHKLQGCGLPLLFVAEWFYGANWAYVVLSRVRQMSGLYILTPLSTNLELYAMPDKMLRMIQDFKDRCGLVLYEEGEYKKFLDEEANFQQMLPTPATGTA